MNLQITSKFRNMVNVNELMVGDYVDVSGRGIDINYVHEFQHLMRILGLSEYANNLKV